MEKIKTGLWKKKFEDKEGNQKQTLTGTLELEGKKYWINIYPNSFKEKENQPDYQMYIQLAEEKNSNVIKVNPTVKDIQKGYAFIDEEIPF